MVDCAIYVMMMLIISLNVSQISIKIKPEQMLQTRTRIVYEILKDNDHCWNLADFTLKIGRKRKYKEVNLL